MKDKKDRCDYSVIFQCFKFYEYVYQCAEKELNIGSDTALVSDRTERLVIDYPDKFINKYFPSYIYSCSDEDIREMFYGVLRSKKLSILIWTDDNRGLCGAGKDTIHIIKPEYFLRSIPRDIEILLEGIEKRHCWEKSKA
ncbi:MAG: hypothetical protein OXK80_05740 [Bdellovibrionales bacterium]|nr:hypothetical protein [Bdellovibrionales bacterium]